MQHRSDCALHSSPAELPSQCSCGAGDPRNEGLVSALTEHAHELDAENKLLHTQLDMANAEMLGAMEEINRLRRALNARLADHIDGTPCAAIRWQHEREELQSQLAEARTGLNVAVRLLCLVNVNDEQCVDTGDMTDSEYEVYTAWCRQVE